MNRGSLEFFCSLLLACVLGACAGDLRHPERFNGALKKYLGEDGQQPPASNGDAGSVADDTSSGSADSDGGATSDEGGGTNAALPDTTPPDCALEVFAKNCALAGCHTKGSKAQVDLGTDGVGDRLVDQQSTSKTCGGRTFIATDGGDSLLVDKLSADPPPCGSKMPIGSKLSDADMKCLTDWVGSLSAKADSGDTQ
jgi:hypothetical protein